MRFIMPIFLLVACGPTPAPLFDAGLGQVDTSTRADAGAEFDAGTTVDAGVAVDAGVPVDGGLDTPANTWTWVDLPGAVCGNNQQTGVGINARPGATELFIYLMGGGACWNELTCVRFMAATNTMSGYGQAAFASERATQALMFNRTDARNPFRDASYVFVPYCTGDVHAGDSVQTYGTTTIHHKGRANITALASQLSVRFPQVRRVILAGSSAGAYGAQLNYTRIAEVLPQAQVHVLADCGQLIQPNGTLLSDWRTAWNLSTPTSCQNCATNFPSYVEWLSTTYPQRRFALLAFDEDNVLNNFFGYVNDTPGFRTATRQLLSTTYPPLRNAKYFALNQASHVMLGNPTAYTGDGGVALLSWVNDFLDGGSAWVNVGP